MSVETIYGRYTSYRHFFLPKTDLNMADFRPNRPYKPYIYSESTTFGLCKKKGHEYLFGTFGGDIQGSKVDFPSLKLKSPAFLTYFMFC